MKRMLPSAFTKPAAFMLCALVAVSLRAQGPKAPPPVPAAKSREVHLTSQGGGSRKETPAGTIYRVFDKVVFTSEDSILRTELAVYNDKTQIANSPGKLKIDDPQNTIVGNTGQAFYKTRDAKITQNVVITVRPKPGDQNAPTGSARREFKDPVTINCDHVDYNWKTRVAVCTGKLLLTQKNRTVTADKLVYYGREEKVELLGNVHYRDINGDKGDVPKAVAILKEGDEEFVVEGVFDTKFKVEEDESGDVKPAETATPPVPPSVPRKTAPTPLAPVILPPPPAAKP